jgi:hypothetical protein
MAGGEGDGEAADAPALEFPLCCAPADWFSKRVSAEIHPTALIDCVVEPRFMLWLEGTKI